MDRTTIGGLDTRPPLGVDLLQVHKRYGDVHVVHGVTLSVEPGEFLVLVGPSGCGKSTLLRMIAGLEGISAGIVQIGGRVVNDVPPKDRDIGMVFQSYALYPHMRVRENLAFGLTLRKTPKDLLEARVAEAARMLGLEPLLDRFPRELSGGQRQRVAIGRAVAREPRVFLCDEPLSNLDAALRVQTRGEIAALHRRLGATMIYVTHDQVEAMTLATRIAVLHGGVLQQVGPPLELYARPANRFVAGFIGSPAMSFLPGELVDHGAPKSSPSMTFACAGGRVAFTLETARILPPGPATLGLRPQALRLVGPDETPKTDHLHARVTVVEPMGSETFLHLTLVDLPDAPAVIAHHPGPLRRELGAGDLVRLAVELAKAHVFGADGLALHHGSGA